MAEKKGKNPIDKKHVLHPRLVPSQKRSEETYVIILETAAKLLGEVGLEGFNTNLLAERAGIRIGTIYRYFPNKLSILSALVERWADLMKEKLAFLSDLGDTGKDWRGLILNSINIYSATARSQPGFFSIRRAMQAAPELRAIEKNMVLDLASLIAAGLEKRGSLLPRERVMILVEVVLMAGAAIFDLAWLRGRKDAALEAEIIEELNVLATSYLSNYFD